ncbi:MAG: sigma-70 family RNA polymerase sigma factor [Phycisphaerales bacterium]|nr:MAG: sigma-70 family RNA polymerase sigma factor [Phycisphaerales bacterium]
MVEDRLLIRRFNAGDTAALRRIYEKYRPDLLSVAAALLNDAAAVEDVLHDVFVGFASQAGRFELKGSLKGYLAVCIANRARNVNRQGRRIGPERLIEAGLRPSRQPDSAEATARTEQFLIVTSALAQLPHEQRQVVVLHVLGSLRFRQIASQAGEPINTIRSRYRYGLRRLQSLLDGQVEL